MPKSSPTLVGIDLGGERKGYHAVAYSGGTYIDKRAISDPIAASRWCKDHEAQIVAVDAPSGWSRSASSRLCEREMAQFGISCFSTPTRDRAVEKAFYRWVLNGEILYKCLRADFPLFDGQWSSKSSSIESFPFAVMCALAGRVVPAKHKARVRREALMKLIYDVSSLANIDFVDAALCAVAADRFWENRFELFGDKTEGIIVVPSGIRD
jgi:predicted nuclease with RNAse H fold